MLHILNGDALKERFPFPLDQNVLIFRESLVDGPAPELVFPDFYHQRAEYMEREYAIPKQVYFRDTVPQIDRIRLAEPAGEFVLWFERDLFCQVNLWCTLALLKARAAQSSLSLVLPFDNTPYAFSGMGPKALKKAFEDRILLSTQEVSDLASLWEAYQKGNTAEMKSLSRQFEGNLDFMAKTVDAHLDRLPLNDPGSRPMRALLRLKGELGDHFGAVFQAFSRVEAIYGFGDLQVRRMWEALDS